MAMHNHSKWLYHHTKWLYLHSKRLYHCMQQMAMYNHPSVLLVVVGDIFHSAYQALEHKT